LSLEDDLLKSKNLVRGAISNKADLAKTIGEEVSRLHPNVYRWAGRMLLDAARIRQRHRILDLAENGN
jgi:hypothetical protein